MQTIKIKFLSIIGKARTARPGVEGMRNKVEIDNIAVKFRDKYT
jgi:hypothetical protein